MIHLRVSLQIILFLIFAVGGGYRFIQPIDVLAKKMLWVSYFDPRIVKGIALIEVLCGIGLVLPLHWHPPPQSLPSSPHAPAQRRAAAAGHTASATPGVR